MTSLLRQITMQRMRVRSAVLTTDNFHVFIPLSIFQKVKTTVEILEDLDTKIKDIENFSISTQERQKRFVGNFLVISIGLYVISSIIFFYAFFPSTWSKRIIYSTPLLIFPIL